MEGKSKSINWEIYFWISLLGIIVITILAIILRIWVLAAIPIGFLFGFFLQKGDLCGSSAMSEIIMFNDKRKAFGLWMVIVTAMAGIALINSLGWVNLNPKPLTYLNYIIGGIVFGIGIVLAGGCVSGCLYKAATGNLNSIVAVSTIPIGIMMVEYGPLRSLHSASKKYIVKMSDGGVVSLPSLLGLSYWLLALFFIVVTVLFVLFHRHRNKSKSKLSATDESLLRRIMLRQWKPWVAGLAIGLLMIPGYLSSAASGRNYPLGVTHGVMDTELILIDSGFNHIYKTSAPIVITKQDNKPPSAVSNRKGLIPQNPKKKIVWWLVVLVVSLVIGSMVSAKMSGRFKLLPKSPDEIIIALLGGILVGIGAAWATGCVVGNIMSGWALMSVGNILFGVVVLLTNWLTTYIYMMGGKISLGKR